MKPNQPKQILHLTVSKQKTALFETFIKMT